MKFPISTRICNELLSDYYQRLEDFWKLKSDHYRQIDYFIKSNSDDEFHSARIDYDELGNIVTEKRYNQIGELVDVSEYEFSEKIVIRKSREERSTWRFNEDKFLVEEIHEYDYDGSDIFEFTLDDQNKIMRVNNDIQMNWNEGEPTRVVKIPSLKPLKTVLKKTAVESSILNEESGTITIYKYDKYERLVEVKSDNKVTSFNFFGYDMMTGSEVKIIIGDQITYKAYNEETLIGDKTVESITRIFGDGLKLSNIIREVRTMK